MCSEYCKNLIIGFTVNQKLSFYLIIGVFFIAIQLFLVSSIEGGVVNGTIITIPFEFLGIFLILKYFNSGKKMDLKKNPIPPLLSQLSQVFLTLMV